MLQALLAALAGLRGRAQVRALTEKAFEAYLIELSNMIEGLGKFLDECHVCVAQSSSISQSDEESVKKHAALTERLLTAAEQHSIGGNSAKKRFTAML